MEPTRFALARVRTLLFALALSAGVTACGGALGTNPTQSGSAALPAAGFAAPATRDKTLVYVAEHTNGFVDVFDGNGLLLYVLTTGISAPAGLFVDAQHNLWVANPGANDVLVFPRGSKSPTRTLPDANQPNDVAVCADGTAFVADALNEGGIAVFPTGHKNPVRRLQPQQSGGEGLESYVTCDNKGNIFATGYIGFSPFPATTGWRHGRESGYYLLPQAAWSTSGIKATNDGTLLIARYANSQPAVVEFTEAGKPTGKAIDTGSDLWGDIALNMKQSVVFGTDSALSVVVALKFPSGAPSRTYMANNLVNPQGVAVDPGD
ncbi:MAG TPA: hypothetical protein VHS56_00465 [Candidatus Cybelea sp.]|nr:hypothetical protein [Candidatus Cybelea sp.]